MNRAAPWENLPLTQRIRRRAITDVDLFGVLGAPGHRQALNTKGRNPLGCGLFFGIGGGFICAPAQGRCRVSATNFPGSLRLIWAYPTSRRPARPLTFVRTVTPRRPRWSLACDSGFEIAADPGGFAASIASDSEALAFHRADYLNCILTAMNSWNSGCPAPLLRIVNCGSTKKLKTTFSVGTTLPNPRPTGTW